MVAYEFCFRNGSGGEYLLGILPERRHGPERITEQSVKQWVKQLIYDTVDLKNVYFVKVRSLNLAYNKFKNC